MKALFLISENNQKVELSASGEFNTLKEARVELMYQINLLANHEDANDMQPTMNFKDRFHFFIDGEKRHLVISNYYKSSKRSIRMSMEAKDKLNNF